MSELRHAFRQLRRQRGFAATVVGTLALTVGATAAMFAIVHAVLVRGLPFASPGRLVWVASVRADNPTAPFTLPEFMDYRRRTRTLSGLAAYANWSASLAGDGVTERLTGARMSANAFALLGVSPAAGRLLDERDDRADAPQVVVASYRLWQRKYGGAADAIGKAVRINGESFVIVGVLPPQFPLPQFHPDVITPLVPDRDPLRHVRSSVNFLRFFGRLRAGGDADADAHADVAVAVDATQARAQAQAELTAICRALRQQFPAEYARKEAVRVTPLHEAIVGDVRQPMLLLLAAVFVVLAAALANLVSLALVRANGRRAELALRLAIGASRLQLTRQLGMEALLLAGIGSGLGWPVAAQAIGAARWWTPASVPRLGEISLDGTAALFVIAITLVVAALLTAAPLAASARTGAGAALREASRGAIGDRSNYRVRHVLVVAEIAAALVLLLAALVLVQNLLWVRDRHPGFYPDDVFQARVSIPSAYRTPDDVSRFFDRVSERLAASPGVAQVGVISVAPLSGLLATVPFSVAGQSSGDASTGRNRPSANLRVISPGYLSTVGTRLLHGRVFSDIDRSNTPPVALVSAALADRLLSGPGRAVGQRLLIDDNNVGPRPVEIVGVIENVRHTGLDHPPALDIYLPLRQLHPDGVSLLRNNQFWMIRTASDPAAFRPTFLAHLRAVDPDAAVSGAETMRAFVDEWLAPRQFTLGVFGAFASTAVLLAMFGLYGLVSYAVSQRAPEIGLRLAIGATPRDVQRLILRQAARLGVAGVVGGVCLAGVARPIVAGLVQEIRIGPVMVAATAAFLIAVVLMAAWLPARRAARIEPTLALKGP